MILVDLTWRLFFLLLPPAFLSFPFLLQKHKVIVLEDLAAKFHLPAQETINRVESLEKMGRITGVMDDRGKFIYIEPEEMQKVCMCMWDGGI